MVKSKHKEDRTVNVILKILNTRQRPYRHYNPPSVPIKDSQREIEGGLSFTFHKLSLNILQVEGCTHLLLYLHLGHYNCISP